MPWASWARAALVAVAASTSTFGVASAPAGAEQCQLPDCRVYEQVSPAEKGSEDAFGEGLLAQTAAGGSEAAHEIAYTSKNVFGGSQGAGVETAYLASGQLGGVWLTSALGPRVTQPLPADTESYAFSGDLSQTVVNVPLEALTPEAPAGVRNLFVRHADGSYTLVTSAPPSVPIPSGCDTCYLEHDVPAFVGASRGFTQIIFEANESLLTTPQYPPGSAETLYESNLAEPPSRRVHPVGILPDGTLASGGAQPGAGGGNFNAEEIKNINHAISEDGSHILFTANADAGGPDKEQAGLAELYDRIGGPGGTTIEVSAPAPGAEKSKCETVQKNCTAEPARFWGASEDGSEVLFTSKAALTKSSNTGPENAGNDLYRYNTKEHTLTDLTPDEKDLNGFSVQGVVGASSNGAIVYFVARGSLYLYKGGAISFIANLREGEPSGEHKEERGDSLDWAGVPETSQAYVTPDGQHLAFTSLQPLTGYDNQDQNTGKLDSEVFVYTAQTSESAAHLECASCNPTTNIRPVGSAFIGREVEAQSERISPLYQPRALSDKGDRVFFSSADALAGSHTTQVKVYEYENHAINLISSGSSNENDIFMDASSTGEDVFFATSQQLAPTDQDAAVDVYDAHICSEAWPCPSASTSTSGSPCGGEACLPLASVPPAFSHPSPPVSGAGNLAPPAVTPRPSRAQLLTKALAACRHEPRRKRATCERRAERRYGHHSARHGRSRSARRRRR